VCKQELATATKGVAAGRELGQSWCAQKGSRGGEQGRGRGGATRGSRSSRRWSDGGSTTAAARCSTPAAGSSRGAEGGQRKKKGGRGPKDLCAKLKDSRDLSVNKNFPLI
jgi:hypothetical protein